MSGLGSDFRRALLVWCVKVIFFFSPRRDVVYCLFINSTFAIYRLICDGERVAVDAVVVIVVRLAGRVEACPIMRTSEEGLRYCVVVGKTAVSIVAVVLCASFIVLFCRWVLRRRGR